MILSGGRGYDLTEEVHQTHGTCPPPASSATKTDKQATRRPCTGPAEPLTNWELKANKASNQSWKRCYHPACSLPNHQLTIKSFLLLATCPIGLLLCTTESCITLLNSCSCSLLDLCWRPSTSWPRLAAWTEPLVVLVCVRPTFCHGERAFHCQAEFYRYRVCWAWSVWSIYYWETGVENEPRLATK